MFYLMVEVNVEDFSLIYNGIAGACFMGALLLLSHLLADR